MLVTKHGYESERSLPAVAPKGKRRSVMRNLRGNTPEEQRKIDEFAVGYAVALSIIIGLFKLAVIVTLVWPLFFWDPA